MGQAKQRGTFEERQAEAIKRNELARIEEVRREAERQRLEEECCNLIDKYRLKERSKPVRARSAVVAGIGVAMAFSSLARS